LLEKKGVPLKAGVERFEGIKIRAIIYYMIKSAFPGSKVPSEPKRLQNFQQLLSSVEPWSVFK